jgi:hypothetical protein
MPDWPSKQPIGEFGISGKILVKLEDLSPSEFALLVFFFLRCSILSRFSTSFGENFFFFAELGPTLKLAPI